MNEKVKRIKELVEILTQASYAYYQKDTPIMSDKEYDDLYEELENLESNTKIILAGSPTQKVQGFVLDGLQKVEHSKPMLSAGKTKNVEEIKKFVGSNYVVCSYKLDGLTIVLRYNNGKLQKAITRGTGYIGEDVTEAAKMITNIPKNIPFEGELELRGECVISWDNFNKINDVLENKYSHPRNLAAGTIRSLDTNIVKDRRLDFVAFELVSYNKDSTYKTFEFRGDSLVFLSELGFDVVQKHCGALCKDVEDIVNDMTAEKCNFPVDGLIFNYEVLSYANSLGTTEHHPLDMIALKWKDDLYETTLEDIEWNTSKTGLINPVAIFKPVDLDGAITTRATLHNVSYVEDLELGIGDTIQVYRSNMVIPKVHKNLTCSNTYKLPTECPCCGGMVEIHNENGSKTLHCTNPDCRAKLLSKLVHAVSRNALNIDGLSEATLEKFIELGWVSSIKDIYHLSVYANRMICLEGFGKKSVDKLLKSIEESRSTTFQRFIYAQSIPLIGKTATKAITKYCNDIDQFRMILDLEAEYAFTNIDGFGKEMNLSLRKWWNEYKFEFCELAKEFVFEELAVVETENSNKLFGKTFCITGKLLRYKNREELIKTIENNGGTVVSGVAKKTDFLLTNDKDSGSSKNKKAKELNIQIISEQEFMALITE